jgi:polysaccharide biosynthesis protein PslG
LVQLQGEADLHSARPRRPFRPYVASLCLVVAIQMLNLTFFGPLARQAPPRRAEAARTAFPYTDLNPYGANTFLSKEVEDWKREKTVQMMAEAGLGWMKQQFPWSEIEPKPGRFWDDKYNQNSWDKYDRIVELAERYGIRTIARLDNTPEWARGPNTNQQTPPADFDRFAEFVAVFVEHYKGRVQYLQIWNEPNLKAEWGGKLDPAAYTALLCKVHARAKAVDPNIVILSAPLAQTLEGGDRGLNELLFLQQLYDAGFGRCFDILMANGYGFDQPPDAPPDPQVLNLRRVELVRAIMERNGDAAKPIWLNEYAWNAAPADFAPDKTPWQRVSEEQQAAYTVEGIRYMRAHWPWLGVVNIWYFRQVGDIAQTEAEFYFRMVDPEWTKRRVYNEVARVTDLQRLALPGRYTALSPALATRGRWATTRAAPTGTLAIRSDRPGDTLKVRFRGNTLLMDVERGPQGGRLSVTVDGSTDAVRGLPQDEKGRRYVDFRAATAEPATLTVVSGLDPLGAAREHEVVLTTIPGGGTTVTIAALEVAYEESSAVFLIVSACAALVGLWATIRALRALGRLRRGRGAA